MKITDIQLADGLEILELMEVYPQYTFQQIHDFMNIWCINTLSDTFDGLVARRNNEIIACAYLEDINPGHNAKCHVIVRHRALKPKETMKLIKENLHILTDRYNLKQLIGVFSPENKACKKLMTMIGFKIMQVPEEYIKHDAKWKQYQEIGVLEL